MYPAAYTQGGMIHLRGQSNSRGGGGGGSASPAPSKKKTEYVCTYVRSKFYPHLCITENTHIRTYVLYICTHIRTVKPVYNDHSTDQAIVVSVDRWSLYGGALVQLKWTNEPAYRGLYRQVVLICARILTYRLPLMQVSRRKYLYCESTC